MTNFTDSTLREQLLQATRLLFQAGVMSHSGHGNMSVRLAETEHMSLASTGLTTDLGADQIPVVTFDGELVEGTIAPVTREIVGMHSGVHRVRPDVELHLPADALERERKYVQQFGSKN